MENRTAAYGMPVIAAGIGAGAGASMLRTNKRPEDGRAAKPPEKQAEGRAEPGIHIHEP